MFLFIFIYRFDTPVYYMSKAKNIMAIAVLEKIYDKNFIRSLEAYDI